MKNYILDIKQKQVTDFLKSTILPEHLLEITIESYLFFIHEFIKDNQDKYEERIKEHNKEYVSENYKFYILPLKETIEVGFRFKNCLRNWENFDFTKYYFLVKKRTLFGYFKEYALLSCDAKYFIFDLKRHCNNYVEDKDLLKESFYEHFEKPKSVYYQDIE